MVLNVTECKSHPDKFLLTQENGEKGHVNGVIDNVRKLTNSKVAELIAIFHDLGKINPNFQDKLDPNKKVNGYANHAYLSAYAFWSFCHNKRNIEYLKLFLGNEKFTQSEFLSWVVLAAKHHGNLPNFDTPDGFNGTFYHALSIEEFKELFKFINTNELPVSDYVKCFEAFKNTEDFEKLFMDSKVQNRIIENFKFIGENTTNALDFFLDTQFTFACLIHADKADAAKFDNFIDDSRKNIDEFCTSLSFQLEAYLKGLTQDTLLNQLRTEIRHEAIDSIQNGLNEHRRVFELTAPTGSGKTLMLLSLASKIIKMKGNYRIIYALPFLSITEQVEAEVLNIFHDSKDFILRIDSKSENERFEKLQEELDNNPTNEKISELNLLEFQENTFSYPLVITTFVRFFETLLGNRNVELLKLPNFSRCIILLDEIQSLPPRLYGFFIAYLTRFCEKFNSYVVISTATQPNFELPEKATVAKDFFSVYKEPYKLLSLKYFTNDLFNRYRITYENEFIEIDELKDKVISESNSVLVILNTIDDTKDLYNLLLNNGFSKEEILLLNTHFTPKHRKLKIYLAKRRLREGKRIILISTQLIEAGVDIDFPVLYRDFATVSSIIQSSGRCNRNGKLPFGKVILFRLRNRGMTRAELIYQGKDMELLTFTKDAFTDQVYQEKVLLEVQRNFFNRIQAELNFAKHSQVSPKFDFDFIKDIRQAQFEKIGKFQLIDKGLFGEEVQYYIPRGEDDKMFEILLRLRDELFILLNNKKNDRNKIRLKKKLIGIHLKKMSGQIVQVRLNPRHQRPILGNEKDCFKIFKIASSSYSFEKGVDLKGGDNLI